MAERYLLFLKLSIFLGLANNYDFKNGVISGPEIPCTSGNIWGGTFVPTTQGLIYTGGSDCDENFYELRGDSIHSLEWIKLNEKLSRDPHWYPAAYPLPTELEVTCT